jgi:hypothetical protein
MASAGATAFAIFSRFSGEQGDFRRSGVIMP